MSEYEKTYQIEKHPSIELSDEEILRRYRVVYKPPPPEEVMPDELKNKLNIARNIAKDTIVIDIQGKKNEKNSSKTIKGKSNKNHSESHKAAMESV